MTKKQKFYTDTGGVIWLNPLMDEVQTGQDTLNVSIEGTSTFDDNDVTTDGDESGAKCGNVTLPWYEFNRNKS